LKIIQNKIATNDQMAYSVSTGLPLCFQQGGDAIIQGRRKELITFVKCWNPDTFGRMLDKTLIRCDSEGCEDKDQEEIRRWFKSRESMIAMRDLLLNPANQVVDGKKWSNGGFGSRWIDTRLNGKEVRIGFYSRKSNPKSFENAPAHKDYMLNVVIDE
jgi:hypothetical protein